MPSAKKTRRQWWKSLSSPQNALATLTVLGVLIYSNTFRHSFVFDDFAATSNLAIRHLDLWNLWQAFNTRFVVGLSLALNYALGQENVVGYHVFNLVVHILNAYFVYRLVCLTFRTPRMAGNPLDPKLVGFLTALVFLTHPLQTQGVTYIWQRATSLAALFYLGALVFYIKARLKSAWGYYVLCFLFTVLGMFTKEIVFTLPLMIVLYEFIFLSSPRKRGSRLGLIPAFAGMTLLATLLIIPWAMTQASEKTLGLVRPNSIYFNKQDPLINNFSRMIRTAGEDRMPRQEFILTELNVLRTYLRLFFLPVNQNVDHDFPRARSLTEPGTFLSLALLLGLLGSALFFFKKHPLSCFGIFWFFLTISVECLVVQENFMFEHRLYLPMAGLSLSLVTVMASFLKNNPRKLVLTVLGIALCYSLLTFERNFVWKNEISLWGDAVHQSPGKARPYNNLGYAYQREGLFDNALPYYNKAIELNPEYADAYCNRASIYGMKGLFDKARVDLNKAIALEPDNAVAYSNQGAVDVKLGLLDKALLNFNKAIQLKPDCAEFYSNRGAVYHKTGLLDLAIADYNKTIELKPNFATVYDNRATAYFLKKEYDKSWRDEKKARELGFAVNPQFIENLKKASGREE